MAKARAISIALVRAMAAFALSLSTAAPVAAADWAPASAPAPVGSDWTRSVAMPASYVGDRIRTVWGYTHFEGHVVGFIVQPRRSSTGARITSAASSSSVHIRCSSTRGG